MQIGMGADGKPSSNAKTERNALEEEEAQGSSC